MTQPPQPQQPQSGPKRPPQSYSSGPDWHPTQPPPGTVPPAQPQIYREEGAKKKSWIILGVVGAVVAAMALWGAVGGGATGGRTDPREAAPAFKDSAQRLCEGLVRDSVGSAQFRDVTVAVSGTSYVVRGKADVPGYSHTFRCDGEWEQDADSDAGTVNMRLTKIS